MVWAGIIGPGLYQINVQTPDVAARDQPVVMSASGFQSAAGSVSASHPLMQARSHAKQAEETRVQALSSGSFSDA